MVTIKRGNTEVPARPRVVEGVKRVAIDDLKAAPDDFEFDLGDDATEEDAKNFQEWISSQLEKPSGKWVMFEPNVKVIDKKAVPVVPPAPETVEESETTDELETDEETDEETETIDEKPATTETPSVDKQNPPSYIPNPGFQYGAGGQIPPYQFDPYTGQRLGWGPVPQPQQPVQQPNQSVNYNPQPLVPIGNGQVGPQHPQGHMPQGTPLPYGYQQPVPQTPPQEPKKKE